MRTTRTLAAGATLMLALVTAHATPLPLDTGVGAIIAAQGNAAIRQIQAEGRRAVTAVPPELPRPVPMALAGAGTAIAAQVRCAK